MSTELFHSDSQSIEGCYERLRAECCRLEELLDGGGFEEKQLKRLDKAVTVMKVAFKIVKKAMKKTQWCIDTAIWVLVGSVLLVPTWCFADVTAHISGPSEVSPGRLVVLDGSQSTDAESFTWSLVGGKLDDLYTDSNGKTVCFATSDQGTYSFILAVAGKDEAGKVSVSLAVHTLTVGTPVPPVPPVPPTPPVPPVPPIPVSAGFRVMVIYETDPKVGATRPKEEREAIESFKVRDYLGRKTARDPDGKTAGYRFWDDDYTDAQMANAGKDWITLYQRAKSDRARAGGKDNEPWIILLNEKAVESRAFVKNEAELDALVRKYGGPD